MKSLFDYLHYRIWTFLRPVDPAMKPSRFSRFLTLFRDCAAIVAIVWAFLLFAFPDVQRLSDKTFGISAYYFMGEYRVCVKKTDAYVPPATGAPLEDRYCWIRSDNKERLCAPGSSASRGCSSPIADEGDTVEQWKDAKYVNDKGFRYGYEFQKLRFHHYKWRANAGLRTRYKDGWSFEDANTTATGLLDVAGDLVVVEVAASGNDKLQLGREQLGHKPADAAKSYTDGRVLTIAESGDCLFVERTQPTGPLSPSTEYPNNIYARMVKVSCL